MSEVVASCSVDELGKIKEQYKDGGVFVIVTQPGCGHCEQMKGVLSEVVKDRVPVIEAGLEDDGCKTTFVDKLGVGVTPTLYFFKGGSTEKIQPDGTLTWDGIREKVRTLAGGSRPANAVSSSTP